EALNASNMPNSTASTARIVLVSRIAGRTASRIDDSAELRSIGFAYATSAPRTITRPATASTERVRKRVGLDIETHLEVGVESAWRTKPGGAGLAQELQSLFRADSNDWVRRNCGRTALSWA